jgi:hypothetical protein
MAADCATTHAEASPGGVAPARLSARSGEHAADAVSGLLFAKTAPDQRTSNSARSTVVVLCVSSVTGLAGVNPLEHR